MSKQREALQMALNALDSDSPDIMLRASIAIREALAEPEQEPVAWMMVNEEHGHKPTLHWKPQEDWHITWKAVPLYTAPPARKPLTDEEIQEMRYLLDFPCNKHPFINIVKAVERAHGIGGGE